MPTTRQLEFAAQVAQAAREAKPTRPRGKPTPENLTATGRAQGLAAMHSAPRCQAKRRDGQPCRAAALRGAARCIKHGGRVEVPDHPDNIRRLLSGEMHQAMQRHDEFREAKAAWGRLSFRAQRELAADVPASIRQDMQSLCAAARLIERQERGQIGMMEFHRRWRNLVSDCEYRAKSS